MPTASRQPYLQDVVTLVAAPAIALSDPGGDLCGGASGCYVHDVRWLHELRVAFDGVTATPIRTAAAGAGEARFTGVQRGVGDDGADPTVLLERHRVVDPQGLSETVTLLSLARDPVEGVLQIFAGADLAGMDVVKTGATTEPVVPLVDARGWQWSGKPGRGRLSPDRLADEVAEPAAMLGWRVRLEHGESFTVVLRLDVEPAEPAAVQPAAPILGEQVRLVGGGALTAYVERSLADLDGLRLADAESVGDHFLAAGAPWYLTLFGRDSLWAARMLLPLGTDLAAGTLRTLARRQATEYDVASAAEPGKILHEIRATSTAHTTDFSLPPLYYGTVDATPLWVLVLHDAWMWGLPEDQVRELLPHARAAMGWLRDAAERGGGFISYRDESGHGLSNQGWKDSSDGVQFRDGSLAQAPVALCEVQGYAYAAATAYAVMVDALGVSSGTEIADWRRWAADLAARFRSEFWVEDAAGRYPAIALDGDSRLVDSLTSNIGHLLGTGLLDDAEEALVAARLASPELDSGFGLRTLATGSSGYNPVSYHAGSVWSHDTAIAVTGLTATAADGAAQTAAALGVGLVEAARAFENRIPELYAGFERSVRPEPVPYPAACRPQAWSATGSVAVLSAALGLRADARTRTVRIAPWQPWPFGRLAVEGLRLGGEPFSLDVDEHGEVTSFGVPPGWRVS